jgi:hypothetical protein
MKSNIEIWFDNGCNYNDGIAIYKLLSCCNRVLLQNLSKKENAINIQKLKYELKKQIAVLNTVLDNEKPKGIVTQEHNIVANESIEIKKSALFFHNLPVELRPVLLEANNLFKTNCLLKTQLNDLPEHAEKKALEFQIQIHRNFELNAQCWKKINFFLEHRTISKEANSEFKEYTPAGLLRKQQLLYASISKLKSRLSTNLKEHKSAIYVSDRSRLERIIAKQESNLIKQNDELLTISKIIDGN